MDDATKTLSPEQRRIVSLLAEGRNVCVDAVAGSGKTTTALGIARAFPQSPVLLLTYSARLKTEARRRAEDIPNLEVHSFHAMAVRYFCPTAFTDTALLRYLDSDFLVPPAALDYAIIVCDECQDMTPLYLRFVRLVVRCCAVPPRLVFMGDRCQSIFGFNGADARFLTMASELWGGDWTGATLSTSYRLTGPMVDLLCLACTGARPMAAHRKEGRRVRYLRLNSFSTDRLLRIVLAWVERVGVEKIFVLAPSVRSPRSPIRLLSNELSARSIPVYVPVDDDEKLQEDVVRGKLVFATYHQCKGLERPCVMVYGIDAGWFRFFGRGRDASRVPNEHYVALTRASEELVVIHDSKSAWCAYLDREAVRDVCELIDSAQDRGKDHDASPRRDTPRTFAVTELLRHVPYDVLDACLREVRETPVRDASVPLAIPQKTEPDDLRMVESVSEISGVAIPSYFELKTTGKMTIAGHLQDGVAASLHKKKDDTAYDARDIAERVRADFSELLRFCTIWCAQKTGFEFKTRQIREYVWIREPLAEEASLRLDRMITATAGGAAGLRFEEPLRAYVGEDTVVGFADMVLAANEPILWELKCASAHDPVHALQLVLYGWLYCEKTGRLPRMYLYNVVLDRLVLVEADPARAAAVAHRLVEHKKRDDHLCSDADFLERHRDPSTRRVSSRATSKRD